MSSIPLPALAVNPPQIQDPVSQFGKLMQIRSMLQSQQQRDIEIQQGQIGLDQTRALNKGYANAIKTQPDGTVQIDAKAVTDSLAASNAGAAIPGVLENINKFNKSYVDLKTAATDLQSKQNDLRGAAAKAVQAANYDPQLAHTILDAFPGNPYIDNLRQTIDSDPNKFKQAIDSAVMSSQKQQEFQNQKDIANIRAQNVDKMEMAAWLKNNPTRPDGTPTDASDYQQFKVDQGVKATVQKETDPRVIRAKMSLQQSEAQIQQTVKNGSAKDAGALLANGVVAPSEITARSNPSFLTQAVQEARRIDPAFNTQKAEADFSVAKSPANLAFFGSAKSLTDKGGTLDQLAEAAKAIPQHEIPVFNSIDDAMKAATGSGPIAKYASLLVGVSDDYSKVMGGGVGSDASRAQGFKLAAASASPEQRAGSIEGIRGAVGSQINSRIGNNKVLRNMYGQQQEGGQQHPFFSQFGGQSR